jgi:hypothetical protein
VPQRDSLDAEAAPETYIWLTILEGVPNKIGRPAALLVQERLRGTQRVLLSHTILIRISHLTSDLVF